MRDHLVARAISTGSLKLWGKDVDVKHLVKPVIDALAAQIVAQATQVWGSGAGLDKLLLTGGGAYFMAPYIAASFQNLLVVPDPVSANARGFYKYARFLEED